MMTGNITPDREGILRVMVLDAMGQPQEIVSVIDTGFTGTLTLPPARIAALGLSWREYGRAILADGSQINYNVYTATIIWDGQPIVTLVNEVDSDSLIGMSLMYGYHLDMPIVDGGTFTLRRIQTP